MKKIKSFKLAIIWFIFIFILISLPGQYIPQVRTFAQWLQWDKIVHLVLYGGFSFFLLIGFLKENHNVTTKHYILSCLFSVLYGAFTELWQHYVCIGRDGNFFDFYADAVGAAFGLLGYFCIKNHLQKRLKSNGKQ